MPSRRRYSLIPHLYLNHLYSIYFNIAQKNSYVKKRTKIFGNVCGDVVARKGRSLPSPCHCEVFSFSSLRGVPQGTTKQSLLRVLLELPYVYASGTRDCHGPLRGPRNDRQPGCRSHGDCHGHFVPSQ